MTAKELEKILASDGWFLKNQKGSHRQYIHSNKPGKVTIPFHGKQEIHPGIVNSILKQAGLK